MPVLTDGWEDLAASTGALAMREVTESVRARDRAIEDELEIEDEEEEMEDLAAAAARVARDDDRARRVMDLADVMRSPTGSVAAASSDEEEEDFPRDSRGRRMLLNQASQASDSEDEVEIADPMKSECRKLYLEAGSSQQVLLAMSLGMEDPVSGRKLGDIIDDAVYANMANKAAFHATVPIFKAEMKRRAKALGVTKLKKNSALRPECIAWLRENPVVDIHDIAWIRKEEGRTYHDLLDLQEEKRRDDQDRLLRANWTTQEPWLRLYHCMVSDEAKLALVDLGRVLDRDELDARNSEDRPSTYWEIVTDMYNDESMVFVTHVLPSLHQSFASEITLRYSEMPGDRLGVSDTQKKIGDAKGKTSLDVA